MTTVKEVDLQKTKGDEEITESLSVEDIKKIFVRIGLKVTDVSMKWANCLLKQKFSNLNGLQSTLIQSKKGLNHCADNNLQIVHCRSNDHWILASTISSVELLIYDSIFNTLNPETMRIVATLFPGRNFKMANCQKQQGGTDCSLFAIANATTVAYGSDNFVFYQSKLREHFLKCLDNNDLVPFP